MSLSDELRNQYRGKASDIGTIMNTALTHMQDMEERLSTIVKILDQGVDMDSFIYDFQSVNQVHKIAYGGSFPKETKPDVPTPAGPIKSNN